MADVGEQHLLVLELVQHPRALLERRRGANAAREVACELGATAQRALAPRVEYRQQVLGLQPDEVLPQEGARAQQARQLAQPLGRGEQVQARRRLVGQRAVDELSERAQSARRVGSERQQVSELLDERDRHAQARQLGRVLELAAVAPRDQERVAHLVPGAGDLHLVDVEVAHGERRGEGVQERGRVGAPHLHPRPVRVARVVEVDRERRERARGGLASREALGQPAAEPLARLVGSAVGHERQQLEQVRLDETRHLGRVDAGRVAPRDDPELVDDDAAAGRRPRRPGPAEAAAARAGGRGRLGSRGLRGLRGAGAARLDVEAAGREHAAQQRECGEEVVADDANVEAA